MEKNKIFILIVLLAFGLLFTSCSSVGDSKNAFPSFGSGSSSSNSGSSSSTGGVEMSFAQQRPPSEMFKGQNYEFAFVFQNQLRVAVEDLQIRTRGFDRGFVTGLDKSYTVGRIPPANDISGPGIFSGLVVSSVRVDNFDGASYSFNPSFDYCYTARTQFREQVCVPSLQNICSDSAEKAKNQNGPVAVTLDSLQVVGNEVLIPITFTNKGEGSVVNTCFDTTQAFEQRIKLVTVKLGSQDGSCTSLSSENEALIDGEASFICTFSRTQDESYISQVSVELEYLYEETLDQKITVKDPKFGIVS